jgi:PIN domain nuclease of toxin-antitoxin system
MLASGVSGLPVEHRHALAVATLPPHHRDPFDRILVAQSMVESLPVVTADPILARYGIATIDA